MGYENERSEEAPTYWIQNALRNQSQVLPDRDTIIGDDDIINIRIALGKSNFIDDLLEGDLL